MSFPYSALARKNSNTIPQATTKHIYSYINIQIYMSVRVAMCILFLVAGE